MKYDYSPENLAKLEVLLQVASSRAAALGVKKIYAQDYAISIGENDLTTLLQELQARLDLMTLVPAEKEVA
jgi:hypothetical protein